MVMGIVAYIATFVAGTVFGAVVMAIVSMSRDEEEDEVD